MKQKMMCLGAILVGTLAVLPGCALLTKNAPLAPRYFSPDMETAAPGSGRQPSSDWRLRLGRVQSSGFLRERMAYRSSEQEVGFYEERRWTERPEAYLRRALARSLFEVHGLNRAVSGAAPTLEAELVAFDEIKGDQHKARVQIVMRLDDAILGSIQRTITVEQEVVGKNKDDPQPVVQALSRALAIAVAQITDQVIESLAQTHPAALTGATSNNPEVTSTTETAAM